MTRWKAKMDIFLTGRAAVAYQIAEVPRPPLFLRDPIPPAFTQEVGFVATHLEERHIAFLLLVILAGRGQLGSTTIAGKAQHQRLRFADFLGMSEHGLRRWAQRNISKERGRILRWGWVRERTFWEASRTGGPWWLAVDDATISPETGAFEFIERHRHVAAARRKDPSDLLDDAGLELADDDWPEALLLLEEAEEMFRRRRWSRKDPRWFEIRLGLGRAQMQLGLPGLRPDEAINVLRSITRQSLVGAHANIIRARAHHIAALVEGQRHSDRAARSAIRHLQHAQEALRGQRGQESVQRYWEILAQEELSLARLNAVFRPKHSSVILQASKVLIDRSAEMRMRYGETLLAAGKPAEAIRYIAPATESGHLSSPAWVVAERLTAAAQYGAGAPAGATLDALTVVEQKARALGFQHQVRLIRRHKKRVREGIRRWSVR